MYFSRLVHELEVSGVRQTVITCSLQIKLYGRTKNLERAMEVFNKMKELGASCIDFFTRFERSFECSFRSS